MRTKTVNYDIHMPILHAAQQRIKDSPAKRKVVRAGRRGGKTTVAGDIAVDAFLDGKRVLYATPTAEQIGRFWMFVNNALQAPLDHNVFYKNETEHVIELRRTEQRIRAKTAWNADTLRGDYADILILDEWQLMSEDAWDTVGAPMLLDNNGDAIFIYTPPSLHSRSASKARDPQHAAKLYKKAAADTSGRWAAFTFSSMDNPYISAEALSEITKDMSALAYRQEIKAEDVDEAPGAMWTRDIIEKNRVFDLPELDYIVVGVDPTATSTGDEAGIITAGRCGEEKYTLSDDSVQGSPVTWARAAITAYHKFKANKIVAEVNNGGEMVELTIHTIDPSVPVEMVNASRGKATRAEPVSAVYEQGHGHHVGSFPLLEDEMCLWIPGDASPNRMDALVWAYTAIATPGWLIS